MTTCSPTWGTRGQLRPFAKAEPARKIGVLIAKRGLTQASAAEILEVDQPKVSALIRGRLAGFSLDRLVRFLVLLGSDVEIVVRARPAVKGRAGDGRVSRQPPCRTRARRDWLPSHHVTADLALAHDVVKAASTSPAHDMARLAEREGGAQRRALHDVEIERTCWSTRWRNTRFN